MCVCVGVYLWKHEALAETTHSESKRAECIPLCLDVCLCVCVRIYTIHSQFNGGAWAYMREASVLAMCESDECATYVCERVFALKNILSVMTVCLSRSTYSGQWPFARLRAELERLLCVWRVWCVCVCVFMCADLGKRCQRVVCCMKRSRFTLAPLKLNVNIAPAIRCSYRMCTYAAYVVCVRCRFSVDARGCILHSV